MPIPSSVSAVLSRCSVLLAALVPVACVDAPPEVDETEQDLATAYKVNVKNRTLSIVGSTASSKLTLRLGATSSTLEVDVGDDGVADFRFDRSAFERIRIDASGGNDVITMNEQAGAFTHEEQMWIDGGAGDDTIVGGFGAETILGGAGNDVVDGRSGNDAISLGAGDDRVVWEPGGASDVIEGDGGNDTLVFHGTAASEQISLTAVGDRLRLTRDVAAIALDLHMLEIVQLDVRGGTDRIVIDDLSGAQVAQVNVDLAYLPGQGDAVADAIVLLATTEPDTIDVWREDAAVVATGHYTEIRVTGGEPALDRLVIEGDAADSVHINGSPGPDTMFVHADTDGAALVDGAGFNVLVAPAAATKLALHGLAGDDAIRNAGNVLVPLTLDGGDGNDELVGAYGADLLLGGAGRDVVDGGMGNDVAFLGADDDTFLWSPGRGSDVIEGEDGIDALIFAASNASDALDVRANGSRVNLHRNIGASTTDLGGVERFDIRALGGNDTITVRPLAGTPATEVVVDLAAVGGVGDTLADVVLIDGDPVLAVIDVTGEGSTVAASGLGAFVRVTGGEPALDRMVVHGAALNVHGTEGADTMTINGDASGPLYDGGGFGTLVAPQGVADVIMFGHAGDDHIAAVSVTTPLHLDGGDGDDTIYGGHGADRLLGGAGHDIVDGGPGADVVLLGEGDDIFNWDPGDYSDTVDGELGADMLVFNASGANDLLELRPNGDRARLYRSIAATNTDLGSIERVDIAARGGADSLVVGDLTGTGVTHVYVDLASYPGSGTGDALTDTVSVLGTPGADAIAITNASGAALVSGLAAQVRITTPEVIDRLDVYGLGGVDSILTELGIENLITVTTYAD